MFIFAVTTCNEERKAMFLLRNHTDKFDIAMIQVNNPAGPRFRFVSEIASETDLSIISKNLIIYVFYFYQYF